MTSNSGPAYTPIRNGYTIKPDNGFMVGKMDIWGCKSIIGGVGLNGQCVKSPKIGAEIWR